MLTVNSLSGSSNMKKILNFMFYLVIYVAIAGVSACSYHSVMPETDALKQQALHHQKIDERQKKEDSDEQDQAEKHNTDEARSQIKNSQLSQAPSTKATAADSDETKENAGKLSQPALMSEQEMQAVSDAPTRSPIKETSSQADSPVSRESQASLTDSDVEDSALVPKQTGLALPEEESAKDNPLTAPLSKASQEAGSKETKTDKTGQPETTQAKDVSDFTYLPEELDDGSEGALSNADDTPYVSEDRKSGNSNINRKGKDTYLMEEGRPKRFWNLQRQL